MDYFSKWRESPFEGALVDTHLRTIFTIDGARTQRLADFTAGSIGIRVEIPSHKATLDALTQHVSTGIRSLYHAQVGANQPSYRVLISNSYGIAAGV
ncbi:hypothetical protein D3C72_1774290 [compost metagenome]